MKDKEAFEVGMSSSQTSPSTTGYEGGATTFSGFSGIHPDVFQTHILTRLDGPTLISTSCTSSQFHNLSLNENLWRQICHKTWPSTNDPRLHHLISTFPAGYRSFFSDAFPLLYSPLEPSLQPQNHHLPELISAVDIHYQNNLIFSKIHNTETKTAWFQCSPLRIDLLDPKDAVPAETATPTQTCLDLAEDLTLSWVVIDPDGKRAANLSSWKPVSVQRHWLSGEAQVRFATILAIAGDENVRKSTPELVQCGIVVTYGWCEEEGEMHVREVYLQVEDMDGKNLNGKDSLVILLNAMENGKRKRNKDCESESRERYEGFMKIKKERKEKRLRREGSLDMIYIGFFISVFAGVWMLVC